jgi:hypothetical protein
MAMKNGKVNSLIIHMIYCVCRVAGGTIGNVVWTQGLDVSLLWLGANVLLIVLMILGSEIPVYGCLKGKSKPELPMVQGTSKTGNLYILSLKRRFPLQILPETTPSKA